MPEALHEFAICSIKISMKYHYCLISLRHVVGARWRPGFDLRIVKHGVFDLPVSHGRIAALMVFERLSITVYREWADAIPAQVNTELARWVCGPRLVCRCSRSGTSSKTG